MAEDKEKKNVSPTGHDDIDVNDEAIKNARQGILTKEQQELIESLDKEAQTRKIEQPLVKSFFTGLVF